LKEKTPIKKGFEEVLIDPTILLEQIYNLTHGAGKYFFS
jgi:hypothetical protein